MTEGGRALSRILVGIDGSERALEAARQAGRLASVFDASVDVVHVVDTGRAHDRDVEAEAETALGRALELARGSGATAEARLLAGAPAEIIVEEAAEHAVDLVVLGPDAGLLHGAAGIGGVARHVLGRAGCSVMLARRAETGFPTTVSCGVDGSDASTMTAGLAAEIAGAAEAELHLVHVVPVFRGRDAEWTLEADEESPPELGPSVEAARAAGVEPVRDMAMGRPEHALVAVARRDGADLLVVGHRRSGGLGRRLLGSVSGYCAEHAHCSVLVARG